jgi:hypothetical protein
MMLQNQTDGLLWQMITEQGVYELPEALEWWRSRRLTR